MSGIQTLSSKPVTTTVPADLSAQPADAIHHVNTGDAGQHTQAAE